MSMNFSFRSLHFLDIDLAITTVRDSRDNFKSRACGRTSLSSLPLDPNDASLPSIMIDQCKKETMTRLNRSNRKSLTYFRSRQRIREYNKKNEIFGTFDTRPRRCNTPMGRSSEVKRRRAEPIRRPRTSYEHTGGRQWAHTCTIAQHRNSTKGQLVSRPFPFRVSISYSQQTSSKRQHFKTARFRDDCVRVNDPVAYKSGFRCLTTTRRSGRTIAGRGL